MMPVRKHSPRYSNERLAEETFEAADESDEQKEVKAAKSPQPTQGSGPTRSSSSARPNEQLLLIEITGFIKSGGPLTKEISLSPDSELISVGDACKMSTGWGWRQKFYSVEEAGPFIDGLSSNQALSLGALNDELSDVVRVVTERKLHRYKPRDRWDVIARTGKYLGYRPGRAALLLFDFDTKGMPPEVRNRMSELGGFWPALTSVVPELRGVAHIMRASTSAGIRRADTDDPIPGSDGQHVYVLTEDGSDNERLLRDLSDRLWLTGLGWYRIGAAGRLLERSPIDRMVGRPERLVFEGPPILGPGLVQDKGARRAVVVAGIALNSLSACPPLSEGERIELAELRARAADRLSSERAAARRAFVKQQASRLIERNPAMSREAAEKTIARQADGVLLPSVELDFVDKRFAGSTVADVLRNPEYFLGEKLADPLEGREYDRDCAYVNLRADGSPWIYSFAHGGTSYPLKFDAAAIEDAINAAPQGTDAALLFVKLMVLADELDPIDIERLKKLACERSGIGVRTLMASLLKARSDARRQLLGDGDNEEYHKGKIALRDFFANLEMHNYIYTPTRKMWPAASVNARIPRQPLTEGGKPVFDEDGNPLSIPASLWLDKNRAVEQITWAPGKAMIIRDTYIVEGGWVDRPNAVCFNLYRPPDITLGNPDDVEPWLDHLFYVYPDDAEHMLNWWAQRVQRPEEKINHALVMGGSQGIGKDTLLEPVRYTIGAWNFMDASPQQVIGRFNAFLKSVILRVNEARDLGEFDRFKFYDHTKAYIAAPPETLLVDEKHLREYYIPNVCGVIISTNHKTNGIYLPSDDRRHYVGWSERTVEDKRYPGNYFKKLWDWYAGGGLQNVAAFLSRRDISKFDPKAPPPKTPAFWAIVDANRAPEEAELADALDRLRRPAATTLNDIIADEDCDQELRMWLSDRSARRIIPYRLEKVGYVPARNPDAKDGLWVIEGKRQAIYVKAELSRTDQLSAAKELQSRKSGAEL